MRTLFASLMLALSTTSWAASLTSQQALQRALYSPESNGAARVIASGMQSQYKLVFTDEQAVPTFYIFTPAAGKGYLIVSGDDGAAPILGYADRGVFDAENIPVNMQYWLEQYAHQINWARQNGIIYRAASNGLEGKSAISPKLTTKWNQDSPYNNLCPKYKGQRCVTGCVATAVAQIMNYHKYPAHGYGSNSYTTETLGINLSANFADAIFDWNNMLNDYSGEYTEEEAEAVATLMATVGISLDMDYTPDESGAYSSLIGKSLPLYFGYDEYAFLANRSYSTLQEWNQLIYDQLAFVGPVEYSGSDQNNSGHSFVCDGYNGDGYFHINWGWGGFYDGYFLLDALSPGEGGIGGGSGAFIYYNTFTGGIQNPEKASYRIWRVEAEDFIIPSGTFTGEINDIVVIGFSNETYKTLNGTIGLKLVNNSNGNVLYFSSNREVKRLEYNSYTSFDGTYNPKLTVTLPNSIEDGVYTATLAWKDENDNWHDVAVNRDVSCSYTLTNSNDIWTIGNAAQTGWIECNDLTNDESLVWGNKCNLSFTLSNPGTQEYHGSIAAAFIRGNYLYAMTAFFNVNIDPGESKNYEEEFTFFGNIEDFGEYNVCLIDYEYYIISNLSSINILNPSSLPSLKVINVQYNSSEIIWNQKSTAEISLQNINASGGSAQYSYMLIPFTDNGNGYVSFYPNDYVAQSPFYSVDIEASATITLTSHFVINDWIDGNEPVEGEYLIGLQNEKGENITNNNYNIINLKITGGGEILPNSISLNFTEKSIEKGESLNLIATVLPENTTDKTVTWSTSDKAVATVTAEGKVTAIARGSATITAKCGDVSASCQINVVVTATNIVLDITELELTTGQTYTLTATPTPEDTTDAMTWSSSDASVVTVDNGQLTAIKAGKATITVRCGSASASCEVIVSDPIIAVTSISLDKTSETLEVGETTTLTATVLPSDATDKTVTWSSSDERIAIIENGKVTAISAGTATITAACGELSASCTITVYEPIIEAESVTLNISSATLEIGETLQLTATVVPENTTDKSLVWKSDNTEVAIVDANGMVTAIGAGTVNISATCGAKTNICVITVNEKEPEEIPVEKVTLDVTNAILEVGETITLNATVSPADATNQTLTWTSSDSNVATVEDGMVTAVSPGSATITVNCDGKTATCEITVNVPFVAVESVSLNLEEADLKIGETVTLTATVAPADATDKEVNWYTSDYSIASVENGLVTAVSAGSATITAEAGGVRATCIVTVTPVTIAVETVTLDVTEATLEVGETITLNATISPADATNHTLTWTSSDSKIATVDNGVVTAVSPGSATITASCDGKISSCIITVKEPEPEIVPIESIVLSITSAEMEVGQALKISATVLPENTTEDTSIAWTSSNIEIASVEDGIVTALAPGTVIITASCGEINATCEITVNAVEVPIDYTLVLSTDAVSINIGQTYQLTATLSPANEEAVLYWTSNNDEVATVDATGLVKGKNGGSATITVSYGEISASCQITVNKLTQTITWDQDFTEASVDDEIILTAFASSGLTVTYTIVDGNDLAKIEGNILSILGMGIIEIAANQAGDNTYLPAATEYRTIEVTKAGINDTTNGMINLSSEGLILTIEGISNDTNIDVYSLDGKVIYKGTDHRITLPYRGSFLVKVSGKVYKVMI